MNAESEKPQVWTIEAVLKWATDDFRQRGLDTPRLDAEVLLAHALDQTRMQLIIDAKRPLAPPELARFRELVKRRRVHEPVAYLRGFKEFYGRTFKSDRRALIPRPDTETLVEVALARTAHVSLSTRAADLCTGTGCVAVTIARERPTSIVFATDLSPEAIALAKDNAYHLGAYNVAFRTGDLFAPFTRGRRCFDVITANPPYIPSAEVDTLDDGIKKFEPRLALDGGTDGLSIIRRIVDEAPHHLAPGGCLAMEVMAGEAPDVKALMEQAGYSDVRITRDYAKIERVVDGICPERVGS